MEPRWKVHEFDMLAAACTTTGEEGARAIADSWRKAAKLAENQAKQRIPEGSSAQVLRGPGHHNQSPSVGEAGDTMTEVWPLDNEAKKYDEGKPRFDLVPPTIMLEIAKVFTFGASKYGDRNWEQGLDFGRLKGALDRHMNAFWRGEDLDEETGLSHLAHAGCCLLMMGEEMLNDAYNKSTIDDRPAVADIGRFDTDARRASSYSTDGEQSVDAQA